MRAIGSKEHFDRMICRAASTIGEVVSSMQRFLRPWLISEFKAGRGVGLFAGPPLQGLYGISSILRSQSAGP